MYTIAQIAALLKASATLAEPGTAIEHLLTDSRRLVTPAGTLFFALETNRRSGAVFIRELYDAGVRSFVSSNDIDVNLYPAANFIKVDDPLQSLQQLAAQHRGNFSYPVFGITGSNGKTIVKEWLYQLLKEDYAIVRSPRSFNSQVGVPLSLWQMNQDYQLGIFEAGISQRDEMAILENMIKPAIGVLTNIGDAHASGFKTKEDKLKEKLVLFKDVATLVYNADDPLVESGLQSLPLGKLFSCGYKGKDLTIKAITTHTASTTIDASIGNREASISIPFTDAASIDNAILCWGVMLLMGIDHAVIQQRMKILEPVEMRLQLKHAINGCSVINDSYSNDLSSLNIALKFLQQVSGRQPSTVILSDLGEVSDAPKQYAKVAAALLRNKINKFIGIGNDLMTYQSLFHLVPQTFFYRSVQEFLAQHHAGRFKDEAILVKGARVFEFEQIGNMFEQQVHQTVMEVNLSAMAANLKAYHQYLQPTTKVMAMVKAFSYGSGSAEVASVLQFHGVDYLAVAYTDEGIELRKGGIHLPIMVMNADVVSYPSLVQYNLEPEIFSMNMLVSFSNYITGIGMDQVGIHIKLDTGMHRLGFEGSDLEKLTHHLQQHKQLVVKSVFTHLVASEDPAHDSFTTKQCELFDNWSKVIEDAIGYTFTRHVSNSAAIFRHAHMQYDMVRLGIGLYGVDSTAEQVLALQPVATLRTTISQIRKVAAGETIGYNRKGIIKQDSIIATIRIGYADGYRRSLSNGKGYVMVKGKLAPVVGSVCMDMTMIDITHIPGVQEDDMVEIFGAGIPVQQVALWCQTIPYEIMTSISHRVKRLYYEE